MRKRSIIFWIDTGENYNDFMKKIFSTFFCILLVFYPIANRVFAISYSSELTTDSRYAESYKSNIQEASLLEIYVTRYRNNINDLYSSYSSQESTILRNTNKELNAMIKVLKKIQSEPINPEIGDAVMKDIVRELKDINRKIKLYLQEQRDLYDERLWAKKQQYTILWKKISTILTNIVETQTQKLLKIENLSTNHKEAVRILIRIRWENQKIEEFEKIRFESEREMKEYFEDIIRNLRKDLKNLRKYL